MSIIEQAAKRLEQLERAGVSVPWSAARAGRLPGAASAPVPVDPAALATAAAHSAEIRLDGDSLQKVATVSAADEKPAPRSVDRAAPRGQVVLNLEHLRRAGYLVPDQVRSELAEQFRHIKRPLLKNARAKPEELEHPGTLIMVTSALPGEGKTFSSINLAMSMAMEVDTAVILVDADVVRPSVFGRLGIESQHPGLLDLLTREDLELQDALVSTNIAKLTLMASGDRNKQSTELLASTAMDNLLTQLAAEYSDHVVIFDAPPLLLTTESSVLASKVGQVIVVVEANKTRRQAVQQAFEALRNCNVVMSVLNKCDASTDDRHYGYYY